MMTLMIRDRPVVLLAERAVWLEDTRTLVVADVHLGKEYHFQAHSIPVPDGSSREDLDRLSLLMKHWPVEHLLVLGDLVHSRDGIAGSLRELVAAWRKKVAHVSMTLVLGNHDRQAGRLPTSWQCSEVTRYTDRTFAFLHEPVFCADVFTFAGHLHPYLTFRAGPKTRERLPVFVLKPRGLILPSFGSFTGGHNIRPATQDQWFVCAGSTVIEWNRLDQNKWSAPATNR